jgi:uncharacterized protein RhaS with RHS repeats
MLTLQGPINRYYDPTTDQFLSVDPLVDQTGQPYEFTNDNPLNAEDPLGLSFFEDANINDLGGGMPTNFGATAANESAASAIEEDASASEQSVRKALSELDKGENARTVPNETSLKQLFRKLVQGATRVFSGAGRTMYRLPDGTTVQYRTISGPDGSGGPTIDIKYPGSSSLVKVHISGR